MRRAAGALLLLVAVYGSGAFAQSPGYNQPTVIMAPVGTVHLKPGGSAAVDMAFRVSSGFHINSNKPHEEFLIPTALTLKAPPQIAVGGVTYPAGSDETFPFAPNEKLSVYSGDFSITSQLKAPAKVSPGTYPVSGELTYQACDKAACYPPKTLPVKFQVTVEK